MAPAGPCRSRWLAGPSPGQPRLGGSGQPPAPVCLPGRAVRAYVASISVIYFTGPSESGDSYSRSMNRQVRISRTAQQRRDELQYRS